MGQLFTSGGQSIGASASALVLPVNIQGWFPLGLIGLTSLLSKGKDMEIGRVSTCDLTCIKLHNFYYISFVKRDIMLVVLA